MDYVELQKAIRDYLECDEETFQQNIERFVRNAENRIYLNVRTPDSRYNAGGTLVAATSTQECPPDLLEPLEFMVTINSVPTHLLLKEPSFISEAYAGVANGAPRYYAILNTAPDNSIVFLLGPTPDVEYDYTVRYIRTPPSIVDVTETYVGTFGPNALLYQSLVEGYTFLKGDPDLLKFYSDKAEASLADFRRICEGVQHMDTYRNPELRVPV